MTVRKTSTITNETSILLLGSSFSSDRLSHIPLARPTYKIPAARWCSDLRTRMLGKNLQQGQHLVALTLDRQVSGLPFFLTTPFLGILATQPHNAVVWKAWPPLSMATVQSWSTVARQQTALYHISDSYHFWWTACIILKSCIEIYSR